MNTSTKLPPLPVLLRFMTFPLDGSEATQLGEDQWIDDSQAFSGYYGYGTKHELSFDGKPTTTYIAAMMPLIRRIPHATKPDGRQILLVVHLTPPEHWSEAQIVTQARLASGDL